MKKYGIHHWYPFDRYCGKLQWCHCPYVYNYHWSFLRQIGRDVIPLLFLSSVKLGTATKTHKMCVALLSAVSLLQRRRGRLIYLPEGNSDNVTVQKWTVISWDFLSSIGVVILLIETRHILLYAYTVGQPSVECGLNLALYILYVDAMATVYKDSYINT